MRCEALRKIMDGNGEYVIRYANATSSSDQAYQTFRGEKGGLPLPGADIMYENASQWREEEGREKLIMFWIAHAAGVICVLNGLCPAIRKNFEWTGQIGGKNANGMGVYLRDVTDA